MPDPALLAPPAAPDCEFKSEVPAGTDPREVQRMKLDYEQQCYRQAEAITRARIEQLQGSVAKTIEAIKRLERTRVGKVERRPHPNPGSAAGL